MNGDELMALSESMMILVHIPNNNAPIIIFVNEMKEYKLSY